MPKLFDHLTTSQFAKRSHYKTAHSVKVAIHQGTIRGAVKLGRQWFIPNKELRRIRKKHRRKELKSMRRKHELPLENKTPS